LNWGEVGRALWPVALGALVLLVGLGRGGRQQMAHFAIMAAFKAGRDLAGAGLSAVSDGDLKKLADSAYTALPGAVVVAGVPVPVGLLKLFLSEGAWENLVQGQYRRFAVYYHATVTAQETPRPVTTPLPVTKAALVARARASASQASAPVALVGGMVIGAVPVGLPSGLVGAAPVLGVAPPMPAPGVVGEGVV